MRALFTALTAALLAVALGCQRSTEGPTLHLVAAVSLREPLEALSQRYTVLHRGAVVRSAFGASGDLATQIAQGAPTGLFASAADEPVERLGRALRVEVLCTLARNELILVRRPDPSLADLTWENLATHPALTRLALGVTPSVPAGVYAERTLTALGVLDALRPKIVRGTNVRQVLELVARGEADAAMVYVTDLRGRRDVTNVGPPPTAVRPAVRYPLVWIAEAPGASDARRFGEWLCGAEGRRVFAEHGFGAP